MRNSALASGAGLIAIRIANAFLGLATVAILARNLSPSEYGLYTMALTVSQFLSLPLCMGIPTLLTREISIAVQSQDNNVLFGLKVWSRRVIFWGSLVLGTLIIGSYAAVRAIEYPVLEQLSWPIILSMTALIPAIAIIKRTMGALSGFGRVAQGRLPDGLIRPMLFLLAASVGLIHFDFSVSALISTHLLAALIAVIFGAWLTRQDWPTERTPDFHFTQWQKSLFPLTVFAAAGAIKSYSDLLMIGAIVGTDQVAQYRVAIQIASAAMIANIIVNAILSPRFAALHLLDNSAEIQRLAVFGSRVAFVAAISFVLMILIIGSSGFSAVLGLEYATSYELTLWLAIGIAASAFFGSSVLILNMSGREIYSARYSYFTAIANIALNAILIPFFGALGAVIATVFTTVLMQALAWILVRRELGIRTDAFGVCLPK